MSSKKKLVIAVDLDGTLAHYDRWQGVQHIGRPITAMLDRVQAAIAAGHEVRIFTARCAPREDGSHETARRYIELWLAHHLGMNLHVTCLKDYDIDEIWDDRAVGVEKNRGVLLSPSRINLEA